jgi:hypothetical protein
VRAMGPAWQAGRNRLVRPPPISHNVTTPS